MKYLYPRLNHWHKIYDEEYEEIKELLVEVLKNKPSYYYSGIQRFFSREERELDLENKIKTKRLSRLRTRAIQYRKRRVHK